jgi:hypothetical protein
MKTRVASGLSMQADVINRGFGGYYTDHFMYMLPSLFSDLPRLKLAVIFL